MYFMSGAAGGASAVVERVDTTTSFTDPSSWTAFDTTPLLNASPPLGWECTATVVDGEYLYLSAAYHYPYVLRFDAKTPRALPPGFSGSFY